MNGFRVLMLCLMAMLWLPAHAQKVTYFHTDALGSPVVATDAARNVVERSEYEPYGKVLNRPLNDGPGYTGHVEDAATGLIYAQQRYYDDDIGRFLSVDPVTAYSDPFRLFNRYRYAANNPYSYTDPDGRLEAMNKFLHMFLPLPPKRPQDPRLELADQARENMGKSILKLQVGTAVVGATGGVAAAYGVTPAVAGATVKETFKHVDKRTICVLLLSTCSHNPATPRDAVGDIQRRPTIRVIDNMNKRNERRAGERADQKERATRVGQNPTSSSSGGGQYQGFKGTFRVEGRIDSKRLDQKLK